MENDINIYHLIKGNTKKQKKHREEVEQKKLMVVLVLGQQCTLGNYKHKRGGRKKKNLGLNSAQLSQIKKEQVHRKKMDEKKKWESI